MDAAIADGDAAIAEGVVHESAVPAPVAGASETRTTSRSFLERVGKQTTIGKELSPVHCSLAYGVIGLFVGVFTGFWAGVVMFAVSDYSAMMPNDFVVFGSLVDFTMMVGLVLLSVGVIVGGLRDVARAMMSHN